MATTPGNGLSCRLHNVWPLNFFPLLDQRAPATDSLPRIPRNAVVRWIAGVETLARRNAMLLHILSAKRSQRRRSQQAHRLRIPRSWRKSAMLHLAEQRVDGRLILDWIEGNPHLLAILNPARMPYLWVFSRPGLLQNGGTILAELHHQHSVRLRRKSAAARVDSLELLSCVKRGDGNEHHGHKHKSVAHSAAILHKTTTRCDAAAALQSTHAPPPGHLSAVRSGSSHCHAALCGRSRSGREPASLLSS